MWIEKLIHERYMYFYSPVAIVETRDLRYTISKLCTAFTGINNFLRCSSDVDVVLYNPPSLYRVSRCGDGSIDLIPISLQSQALMSTGTFGSTPPVQVIEFFMRSVRGGSSTVLIYVAVSVSEDVRRLLTCAISNLVGDPRLSWTRNMCFLVIVTDDASPFKNILDNVIFVRSEPYESDIEQLIDRMRSQLKNKYGIEVPISNRKIIELLRGIEYKDVENILFKVAVKLRDSRGRLDTVHELISRKAEMIHAYTDALELVTYSHGFEAVGGYEQLKNYIRRTFINVWKNHEIAEKFSVDLPRGILLFGIRGTGKTHFVRCLSREIDIPLFRFRIEMLMSRYYGETERELRKIFSLLRKIQPVMLFIDEVDKVMTRRGTLQEHEVTRRIKNIILEEMSENDNIIWICTTNYPESLDEAFLRAGRIDIKVPFLLPDQEARLQILEVHTRIIRKVPLSDDVDLRKIASVTHGWTGAELEQLVKDAVNMAFNEYIEGKLRKITVEMRHFETAMENIVISREERMSELERYVETARRLTSHRELLMYVTENVESMRMEATKLLHI